MYLVKRNIHEHHHKIQEPPDLTQKVDPVVNPDIRDLLDTFRDLLDTFRDLLDTFRDLLDTYRDLLDTFRDLLDTFRDR